jgi:CDP-diacylglycerol--serine O-phosphatidyltransferase
MSALKPPGHRGVYILPNLFTTGSLLAAFVGLALAHGGQIESCALAVLVSAVLDGLDGKVARLTNTASEFGIQYDSLADLVAFGVTPGFMVWIWAIDVYGRLGLAASFLFVACAALRLARFNISTTAVTGKKFFIGLPSPAAGCTLAMLVFARPCLPEWMSAFLPPFVLCVTCVTALLMVSRVRYFSFKEFGFLRAHPFSSMVATLVVVSLIFAAPRIFGPLLCLLYVLSGIVYTFILLPSHNRKLLRLSQNLN